MVHHLSQVPAPRQTETKLKLVMDASRPVHDVCGDSELVLDQVQGYTRVLDPVLQVYHAVACGSRGTDRFWSLGSRVPSRSSHSHTSSSLMLEPELFLGFVFAG